MQEIGEIRSENNVVANIYELMSEDYGTIYYV
jgi:hypothetical protein